MVEQQPRPPKPPMLLSLGTMLGSQGYAIALIERGVSILLKTTGEEDAQRWALEAGRAQSYEELLQTLDRWFSVYIRSGREDLELTTAWALWLESRKHRAAP